MAESVQAGGGRFFLEAEKAAGDLAVNPLPLEDTSVNHHNNYEMISAVWG